MDFDHKHMCNETWESHNRMNLAAKARSEDHEFERSKQLNSISDKGIKLPSYEKILHIFGVSSKKNISKSSSANELSFFGLESVSDQKAFPRCEKKEAFAVITKAKSLSKLQENFTKQFSMAQENMTVDDRNPCKRIDRIQSFLANHQMVEPPVNANSADFVESGGGFVSSPITMRSKKEGAHCDPPANAHGKEKNIIQYNSASSDGQKNHLKMTGNSLISPLCFPEQPLKSILRNSKYSSQGLHSSPPYFSGVLNRDGVEQEEKPPVRYRSKSSVQFTAPTVHFILCDQQNSGWYTREDEIKMIRRLQRAKQKRLEKKSRKGIMQINSNVQNDNTQRLNH